MFGRRCVAFLLAWAVASIAVGDSANDLNAAPPEMRPALAFQQFLRVARRTESMEDVLPLLSRKEARMVRVAQQYFDPDLLRQEMADTGALNDEQINEMLSRTPYESALRNYKNIAKQVKEYVRTEIDGESAIVHVKTSPGHTMLDGKAMMVLEQGAWKLDEFETDLSKLFDSFR